MRRFFLAIALMLSVACISLQAADKSIAVFTFDNLTGSEDHAWLGNGFAEELSSKLANLDSVIVNNRRKIAEIAKVSKIDQRKINNKNAAETGKLVGSDYIIFGAVQSAGAVDKPESALRVTARMVEVKTGVIGKAIQLDGHMKDIFSMQKDFALRFATLLNVEISEVARNAIGYHSTDSLAAYRKYCLGLGFLDSGSYDKSIVEFKEACSLHPGILYAEAHHELGTAYIKAGRKEEMLKEFKKDTGNFAIIWYDLWQAYKKAGKHKKALEAFKTFDKYKNLNTQKIIEENK